MSISLLEIAEQLNIFGFPIKIRKDGTKLKVSQDFWDWIKYHEGSPKKKGEPILTTYKDSKGILTIGYGHTGPDVKSGMNISKDLSLKLLYSDAAKAANCVRRFLTEWKSGGFKGYKLTQSEFDALVSIVFNSGCNSTRTSQFIKYLKSGDYKNAANYIKVHKSSGLTKRRDNEFEMFKNNKYIKN
jgi:lysozyme